MTHYTPIFYHIKSYASGGLAKLTNVREAANNAFLNGQRLASQLNTQAPNLRKLVLIAHSACGQK